MTHPWKLALLLILSSITSLPAADDITIADFESANYSPWKTTGEAFGPGPAQGTLPGQMKVEGFKGKGLVNSFHKGDDTTGTLTSPEFKIERKYISFLIGGGKNLEKLTLNLLVEGKVARSATGPNDKPGGSEALVADYWDLSEFAGKSAVILITDNAKGGWGHINVDHIVQTDKKPPGLIQNARREFQIANHFLNLPIKNGGPKRVVKLLHEGKLVVRNDIELADGTPDWWAPMDLSAFAGKSVVLEVDKMPEDSKALTSIEASDTIRNARNLYQEPLRGQLHFSPKRGWNNDPNGMVYFNGEYHLFFQHNPYGWGWGNMHWGHAVSRDMVHWQELGDKLLPDEMGPMFSGSAVVDWQNTSGFGQPGKPALVLFYTAAGDPTTQCLAYSTDGRTFTKYNATPIVKQITGGNRDPKVLWHEPSKQWVMTLYVELDKVHTIHFFTSSNLKKWKFASKTDGFFECPDFFELAVDGNPAQKKWVLTAANSEYMVGSFDGTKFTPETPKIIGQRGKGFYAAQTFSDIPAADGRRIQIGWFQTETKGMPFNQSMTMPLELQLVSTAEGPRLSWSPVKEMQSLVVSTNPIQISQLQPDDKNPLAGIKAELARLDIDFEPGQATDVIFNIRGAEIRYEVKRQDFHVNGHRTFAPLQNGRQKLTIFVDRASLELFASDGLSYIPMPFQPRAQDQSYAISAKGGSVKIHALTFSELQSAWTSPKTTASLNFNQKVLDQARAELQKEVANGHVVAAAHLVVQNGKPVYHEVVGLADAEDKSPLKPDSIVRIYSMSKALTSAAAMTLYDQGKFQLDDPVSKYIPAFAHTKVLEKDGAVWKEVPARRQITVRDLFRHTSGYSYGGEPQYQGRFAKEGLNFGPPMGMYPHKIKLKDAAEIWAKIPAADHPGSRFIYGLNTDLLGRLVEIWSGKPLDEYIQEAICKPLEMVDTGFKVPEEKRSRFVSCHTVKDGKAIVVDKGATSGFIQGFAFLSGGGGMVSTMADYGNFCQMLVDGGLFKGVEILKPETVREMLTNQMKEAAGPMQFGLGFAIHNELFGSGNDQQLVKEFDWAGYATTDFRIYPDLKMYQIYLRQHLPSDYGFNRHQMDVIQTAVEFQKLAEPAKPQPNIAAGTWALEYELEGNAVRDEYHFTPDDSGQLSGKITRDGKEVAKLENIKLVQDKITFSAKGNRNGTEWTAEFTGQVVGDDIEGDVTIRVNDQSYDLPWKPKRVKTAAGN